jgi:nucleoside 2-deoxyribosyltransferase
MKHTAKGSVLASIARALATAIREAPTWNPPCAYFVGPAAYSKDASDLRRQAAALCRHHGMQCFWPSEYYLLPDGRDQETVSLGGDDNVDAPVLIYRSLCGNIRDAHAIVADISPFRGPHLDAQTAFALGFAHALNKPIFAYTTSSFVSATPDGDGFRRRRFRLLAERIWTGDAAASDGRWRDEPGYQVENFGLVDYASVSCAVSTCSDSLELAVECCAQYFRIHGPKLEPAVAKRVTG